MVDGTPKVMLLSIYPDENLIEMPTPVAACAQQIDTPFADIRREHRAKPFPPKPHGFVANIDSALVQKIFDIPQRKRMYIITARRITSGLVLK